MEISPARTRIYLGGGVEKKKKDLKFDRSALPALCGLSFFLSLPIFCWKRFFFFFEDFSLHANSALFDLTIVSKGLCVFVFSFE